MTKNFFSIRAYKIIILEITLCNCSICRSIYSSPVHFISFPFTIIKTAIYPRIFSFSKSHSLIKLPLIKITISKRISTKTMFFTVFPHTVINISSVHFQNSLSLFFIINPKAFIKITIEIFILALSMPKPISPLSYLLKDIFTLIKIIINVVHSSYSIFLVLVPMASKLSLRRFHKALT